MGVITTFDFSNPASFTAINSEVVGGFGQLALVDKLSLVFNQPFAADTGFTYDSLLAEFSGGVVRQIDRTPSNSQLAADYDLDANFLWRKDLASLAATLVGVPTFVGGRMVCTGNQGARYASYVTTANETLKVKYTPNYTGAPPSNVNIMASQNLSNNNDRFILTHSPSGNTLRGTLYTNTGGVKLNVTSLGGAWSPTAGQEYELEFVVDSSTGIVYIFIDGVLHNSTNTGGAFARGGISNIIDVGASTFAYNRAEASFNDFIIFNDAQHTSNYTPGYVVPTSIYGESAVDLPDFTYATVGTIKALTSLVTVETQLPRYVVEGQYWDGAAWVPSDNSYSQASSKATVLANLGSLDVDGQTAISISLVFPDSNTQNSVDDLTLTYTGQRYPVEGTLTLVNSFVANMLIGSSFDTELVLPLNTASNLIAQVNGQDKWYDGTNWVDSDGTFLESNTLTQFQTNAGSLLTANSSVKIKVVLSSSDDQATPQIDFLTISYDRGVLEPTDPNLVFTYGFVKTVENLPIVGATVLIEPNRDSTEYIEAAERVIAGPISKITDANGFFSYDLIPSSAYEPLDFKYRMTITLPGERSPVAVNGEEEILFDVPDGTELNLTSRITAV